MTGAQPPAAVVRLLGPVDVVAPVSTDDRWTSWVERGATMDRHDIVALALGLFTSTASADASAGP